MEVVWAGGSQGATVAEIWQAIALRRAVGRTTILNLVDRLEKRGWLNRRGKAATRKPFRYLAALDRQRTAAFLAGGFVDDFFAGSASNLVMSLLGCNRIKPDDLHRLRDALDSASREAGGKRGR
jgi:predicted transcriptional regulator